MTFHGYSTKNEGQFQEFNCQESEKKIKGSKYQELEKGSHRDNG